VLALRLALMTGVTAAHTADSPGFLDGCSRARRSGVGAARAGGGGVGYLSPKRVGLLRLGVGSLLSAKQVSERQDVACIEVPPSERRSA
jgi:hypothetical protein